MKKSLEDSTQAQKHIQAIQQLTQVLNHGKMKFCRTIVRRYLCL